MYRDKNTVIWKVEQNTKEEVFCLPYRTRKKVPWWNWSRESEWSVPRAQKRRAGVTDPKSVIETVNQKVVQKKKAKKVRQTFKLL